MMKLRRSCALLLLSLCIVLGQHAEGYSFPSIDSLLAGLGSLLSSDTVVSMSDSNSTSNETTPSPSVTPGHNGTNSTFPPTIAPAHNGTNHNATEPPLPSNATIAPTPLPHNETTQVPHNATTEPPNPSNHTSPPSPTPSNSTTNHTIAPTPYHPSNYSSLSPTVTPSDEVVPKMSFWRIVSKTIAWLIFIGLSVLAFGGIMSNRYRIYFFLRGVWYTLLRMECTQWILRKLRFGDHQVDSGLNTIIFDSEMSEGLLLNENRQDV